MTNRKYNCKDVDLLTSGKTITKSLSDNLDELSNIRTNWTKAFVDKLDASFDNAIKKYLGTDNKTSLKNASAALAAIQGPALRDLSFLRTQIEVDFEDKAPAMLMSLGFTKNIVAAQKGNQEALIELLHAFNQGLTAQVKKDIVAKGTNPKLLNKITGYATDLLSANIEQESLKETTKELTEEEVVVFNALYTKVIGICKIASNFYRFEPLKKKQFTFSHVVSNMSIAKKMESAPIEG